MNIIFDSKVNDFFKIAIFFVYSNNACYNNYVKIVHKPIVVLFMLVHFVQGRFKFIPF